jgi:hypothetical protein
VVREFRIVENGLRYTVIGYGPRLAPIPRDTPLEVYISPDDPEFKRDPSLVGQVRRYEKSVCGGCHPILNPETSM